MTAADRRHPARRGREDAHMDALRGYTTRQSWRGVLQAQGHRPVSPPRLPSHPHPLLLFLLSNKSLDSSRYCIHVWYPTSEATANSTEVTHSPYPLLAIPSSTLAAPYRPRHPRPLQAHKGHNCLHLGHHHYLHCHPLDGHINYCTPGDTTVRDGNNLKPIYMPMNLALRLLVLNGMACRCPPVRVEDESPELPRVGGSGPVGAAPTILSSPITSTSTPSSAPAAPFAPMPPQKLR